MKVFFIGLSEHFKDHEIRIIFVLFFIFLRLARNQDQLQLPKHPKPYLMMRFPHQSSERLATTFVLRFLTSGVDSETLTDAEADSDALDEALKNADLEADSDTEADVLDGSDAEAEADVLADTEADALAGSDAETDADALAGAEATH